MNKKDTTIKVDADAGLMQFLLKHLKGKNRDNIKSLLRNKQVWINNSAVSQFNFPVTAGQEITIRWARKSDLPSSEYLNIVFEDDHIIVVEKKAGLLSVSDGNAHLTAHAVLSEWVIKQNPNSRVFIVHRLDQYTSGLLMFVKSQEIQNIFRNDWKNYIKERTYTAVVEGEMNKMSGSIRSYLSENAALVMVSGQNPAIGKFALTHYRVIKTAKDYSMLEVKLETGRKNQIRVHMQDIGHPVAGDRKYGAKTNPVGRLCLHATILAFIHPVTNEILRFESKIPGEFTHLF